MTKRSSCCLLFVVAAIAASAATNEPSAASRPERVKLVEKEFNQLTDKMLSKQAKLALDEDRGKWRHGETDHFVFHFQRLTEAQKLAREAEFYYWKIKDDLAVKEDLATGKSHIIMFAKPQQWKIFTADVKVPPWSVGFAAGREMFMLIEAGSQNASDRLAHEMTHLVFFRFVPKHVPLWLNEGFAEYESSAAYAKFKGVGTQPTRIERTVPMDLKTLTALETYPERTEEVYSLYKESERLVRFLITRHPRGDFVPFVNLLADGVSFEDALLKTYALKYRKLDDFRKAYDRF